MTEELYHQQLAIAFRKEFDSDSDSRFIGLKYDNWRDEKTYQIKEKICDPVILEDPSVATCDQFDAIIQLKETRRRASQKSQPVHLHLIYIKNEIKTYVLL